MLSRAPTIPFGEHNVFFPERTVPLRAMLGTVGHSRITTASYNWHGQKRGRAEFFLFQYTLKGRGRLRIGERETAVVPGQAMLLHFPDDNQYWLPADSDSWEFVFVCLHGREVARLWRGIEHALGTLMPLAGNSSVVRCAHRIVNAALTGEITHAYAASSLAYEFMMGLSAEARNPRTSPQTRPALENARRFAEARIAQPLTVADLARAAGMSRYHFTRLFAAHAGSPPAAWLTEQRVREAARLLRGSELPLKEIATQCGFPNASYLSRVFRRQTGIPPASYRRSGA